MPTERKSPELVLLVSRVEKGIQWDRNIGPIKQMGRGWRGGKVEEGRKWRGWKGYEGGHRWGPMQLLLTSLLLGAAYSEDPPSGAQWWLFSPPYISLYFLKVSQAHKENSSRENLVIPETDKAKSKKWCPLLLKAQIPHPHTSWDAYTVQYIIHVTFPSTSNNWPSPRVLCNKSCLAWSLVMRLLPSKYSLSFCKRVIFNFKNIFKS